MERCDIESEDNSSHVLSVQWLLCTRSMHDCDLSWYFGYLFDRSWYDLILMYTIVSIVVMCLSSIHVFSHGCFMCIWLMMVSLSVGLSSSRYRYVWCCCVRLWEGAWVVASSCYVSIRLIVGNTVLLRCWLVYVNPISTWYWLWTMEEAYMIITGVFK